MIKLPQAVLNWWRVAFRENEKAWRVHYPDGMQTVSLRLDTALSLREIHGGRIEWAPAEKP